MAFSFVPKDTKIDFVGFRFVTFGIALLFIILGTLGYIKGLNFGIDFKGGHLIEVHLDQEPQMDTLRQNLHDLGLGDVTVQQAGSPQDLMIKIELQNDQSQQENAIAKIKSVLGENQDYRKISTVGPKVGEELIANALNAILLSLLCMMLYIAFRFEWQFAVCALTALFHDCIAILCLFAWTKLEFNETSVIAILITAGYSINDTIVIFDRIRENLKRYRKMDLAELINKSLNETLSRTVMTATTTLLALVALYIWGGSVISSFSLPIIIGIMIGSFSSICLAAPLLLYLNIRKDDGLENDKKEAKDVAAS